MQSVAALVIDGDKAINVDSDKYVYVLISVELCDFRNNILIHIQGDTGGLGPRLTFILPAGRQWDIKI